MFGYFSVFVFYCVDRSLATGCSLVQGALPSTCKILKPEKCNGHTGPQRGVVMHRKKNMMLSCTLQKISSTTIGRGRWWCGKVSFLLLFSFVGWGGVGWGWIHLICRPLIDLSFQLRMIDEYEEVGGMTIGRGNRGTRRNSAPVPLCPPQIPYDLTWDRTRTAAVGS
jgi:hypothetical protein